MNKILGLFQLLCCAKDKTKIGFLTNYVDLSDIDKKNLLSINDEHNYVDDFEKNIANEFGSGKVIAFASGRMGFYSILKALSIGQGDEVAVTGFSCSVMVNAILRIGATPIFVDIDKDTLGTSPLDLEGKITEKTKVVVAQHTFGLPCRIDKIAKVCKDHGIFLVEDCALTLCSSYKGVKLGDWGDATIFSTDHSKPLNSMIGGGVYTKDSIIYSRIKKIQETSGNLTHNQVMSLVEMFIKEKNDLKKNKVALLFAEYLRLFGYIIMKLFRIKNKRTFDLYNDFSSNVSQDSDYPYPARMPQKLAFLALRSLEDYKKNIQTRKEFANKTIAIVTEKELVPNIFFDLNADIVPLRVAYILKNKTKRDYSFLDTGWIWFQRPIVATSEDLKNFGYAAGSCPNSEEVGKSIMNIPIYYDLKKQNTILRYLSILYNN